MGSLQKLQGEGRGKATDIEQKESGDERKEARLQIHCMGGGVSPTFLK